LLEVADRSGNRNWWASAREINQSLCLARGNWQAAREFADQGLALMPTDSNLLGSGALVEYAVGDFETGEAYLKRLLEIQRGQSEMPLFFPDVGAWTVPIVVFPMVARCTEATDCFDMLEAAARSIISSPSAYLGAVQGARIGLALIAVQQGGGKEAKGLHDSLQELRGTVYPQAPVGPGMAIDRLLGMLSHTMAELDQAATHFEAALAFCRNAGYRPELAWTCCDYADALRDRDGDGDGDRTKAVALLDESLAISSELGMRPLMERVLSRREILKA
jgi:tetratricopeptide (TPR) repeat protein